MDWNLGDEPSDDAAVTLGIELWDKYQDRLTVADFKRELALRISSLDRYSPRLKPIEPAIIQDWPYYAGYFNNTGREYIPESVP